VIKAKEAHMQISRNWTTPLTIGAFIIMSSTGLLMFFRLNLGISKLVHEWGGLVLISAVLMHVIANWFSFKRYFVNNIRSLIFLICCSFFLSAALFIFNSPKSTKITNVVFERFISSPIKLIAPMTKYSSENIVHLLEKDGFKDLNTESNLKEIAQGDKERLKELISVIFKE